MKHSVFATAAFLLPTPALAYIGPGAGLGAIAATAGLGLAVLLLIVGFLWYPLKRMLRGTPKHTEPAEADSSQA